jgi:hypothetical protein
VTSHSIAAMAVTLIAVGGQAADWRTWLMRAAPRQIAGLVDRDGRDGDLVVVFPPAHASAFSFTIEVPSSSGRRPSRAGSHRAVGGPVRIVRQRRPHA